ncbi:hypothetical protein E2C01_005670 [Portunus trituberculatus]|uniref:Uncharacterized protein n=1 Tax=Portunus trituberculatus TaxID=210409 RepID=A0A5B7CZR8_PORTR|nr:hypothetical protein [Portunus trituberculatus]
MQCSVCRDPHRYAPLNPWSMAPVSERASPAAGLETVAGLANSEEVPTPHTTKEIFRVANAPSCSPENCLTFWRGIITLR